MHWVSLCSQPFQVLYDTKHASNSALALELSVGWVEVCAALQLASACQPARLRAALVHVHLPNTLTAPRPQICGAWMPVSLLRRLDMFPLTTACVFLTLGFTRKSF